MSDLACHTDHGDVDAKESGERDLGTMLLEARKARGFSQNEAALRAQVGLRTYVRWEHGENRPQAGNLASLAHALGIDHGELARAAGSYDVPIDVQAAEARRSAEVATDEVADLREQVADLSAEVDRLQRLVRTYEGPTEEQLRAVVDLVVAARLAELDATPGAPAQPDAAPRERGQQPA
jgi:transcriptional regulator with XRE-family HTH domain